MYRMSGLCWSVHQTLDHFQRMQGAPSPVSSPPIPCLFGTVLRAGNEYTGTESGRRHVLDRADAVEGPIDSLGTLSEAIDCLYGMIDKRRKQANRKKKKHPEPYGAPFYQSPAAGITYHASCRRSRLKQILEVYIAYERNFSGHYPGNSSGATEFLPVSSSGHLALSQHLMGSHTSGLSGLLFDVMLHLGTLAAVLLVYLQTDLTADSGVLPHGPRSLTGKFKWSEMNGDRNLVMMLIIGLLPLFLLFIPIPGTGLNLKDIGESFANGQSIMIRRVFVAVD